MDREALLGREDEAWAAFSKAFIEIPEDRRDVEGVVPGWSVKDLVWHCGYWADYVGDVLERLAAGQPEPPDQDWDALNRMVADDGTATTWDEVVVAAELGTDPARQALLAMHEDSDPYVTRYFDLAVHPEQELLPALAVAREDVERREVLLRRVWVQRRDHASRHRVADLDDGIAEPEAASRPRVLLERLRVGDLDQHPEAAGVEVVNPATVAEVVDGGARNDRDPVDPTGVLGLVDP